jgi:hypothetical protein
MSYRAYLGRIAGGYSASLQAILSFAGVPVEPSDLATLTMKVLDGDGLVISGPTNVKPNLTTGGVLAIEVPPASTDVGQFGEARVILLEGTWVTPSSRVQAWVYDIIAEAVP